MNQQPTVDELLEAVGLFIESISGQLADREKFLARVALNALAIVQRDLRESPQAQERAVGRLKSLLVADADYNTLNRALCAAIEKGQFDGCDRGPLLAHLRASAVDRVKIDQPSYSGLTAAEAQVNLADELRSG